MQNIFDRAEKSVLKALKAVGKIADKQNLNAFAVGGFVRDLILKRPNCDIDIVVEGDAIKFADAVARLQGLKVKSYKRFGTATISDREGFHVDFVTARSEIYAHPGALPTVRKSGLKEDLFRRDFSINALAASINSEDFGALVDHYEGLQDLKEGVIRIFYDKSFKDDPTRILRAVRFEQRFGFRFEARTRRRLKNAVAGHFERTVSAPRYFQEFARGFEEEHPEKFICRLQALHALGFLGLSVLPSKRILERLGSNLEALGASNTDRKFAYWSVLFSKLSPEDVVERAKKFQWTREDKKNVLDRIHAFLKFQSLSKSGETPGEKKKFLDSQPDPIKFFIRASSSY